MDALIDFGKYRGNTIGEVKKSDPGYLVWIWNQFKEELPANEPRNVVTKYFADPANAGAFEEVLYSIVENKKIGFGKYADFTYAELLEMPGNTPLAYRKWFRKMRQVESEAKPFAINAEEKRRKYSIFWEASLAYSRDKFEQ